MEHKSFQTRYLRGQEIIKTREMSRMFKRQKEQFATLLESFDTKSIHNELQAFIDQVNAEDVEYLLNVMPAVMKQGAKPEILKYKDQLPKWYALGFDLPTEPASIYLRNLEKLHLSDRDGSISKTTNDEIRKIIADGIDQGQSYSQVAKIVRETDPFVFSKTRANLIAVQEIGQAYWFANFEPARELDRQGYVMMKEWQAKKDMKTRPTHAQNESDGMIPLDQPFSGTGDEYAPSQEFRCRCTSSTEIVGLKKNGKAELLKKYEFLQKLFE